MDFFLRLFNGLRNLLVLEDRGSINIRHLIRFFLFSASVFVLVFSVVFVSMLKISKSHQLANFKNEDLIIVLKELQKLKLKVYIYAKNSTTVPIYHVIEQRPSAGTRVKEGRTILLTVSQGKQLFAMPNYVGKSYPAIKEELDIRLLPYKKKPRIVAVPKRDSTHPNDYVLAQSIPPGQTIEGDGTLFFLVNKIAGKELLKIENYRLKNYRKVANSLAQKGVKVKIRKRRTTVKEQMGKIFTQSLVPGEYFDKETSIVFYVGAQESDGPSNEILRIYSLVAPEKKTSINPYATAPTTTTQTELRNTYLYIKLVVYDELGKNIALEDKVMPGQLINLPYKTLGAGYLEVFIDGVLYEKQLF